MDTQDLWQTQLNTGAIELGCHLEAWQRERLLRFLALLVKWNRAFNLTAVRDPRRMVSRHLLDSLSLLPYLDGPHLLDVGTGAGLPGIPLAVARPEWSFTLLDSNAKKTRFVRQASLELGLQNVVLVHDRVERWQAPHPLQNIICRAFAPLDKMLALTRHLASSATVWAVLKGPTEVRERTNLPVGVHAVTHVVRVPTEAAQRRVVLLHYPAGQ